MPTCLPSLSLNNYPWLGTFKICLYFPLQASVYVACSGELISGQYLNAFDLTSSEPKRSFKLITMQLTFKLTLVN